MPSGDFGRSALRAQSISLVASSGGAFSGVAAETAVLRGVGIGIPCIGFCVRENSCCAGGSRDHHYRVQLTQFGKRCGC